MNKTGKCTILVVDDDTLLREVIVEDLQRQGLTVLAAEDGNRALEIIRSHPIDLVVSDVRMPGCTGLEMLERLRAIPEKPSVILITGFTEASESECLALGARCVIQKPFQRKVLIRAICDALEDRLGKDRSGTVSERTR